MRRRFLAGSLAAGAGVSADEAAAGALLVIGTVGSKASGFAAEAECIIAGEMKAAAEPIAVPGAWLTIANGQARPRAATQVQVLAPQ